MSTPEVGFVPTYMLLRPPRVAILVPDDHRWRDWAMTALATASDYWGGVGHILVPYDPATGTPSPLFADVVRAYDPDHVVVLEVSMTLLEDWYPGVINIAGTKSASERRALIANSRLDVEEPGARQARDEVASWCSPMRMIREVGGARARPREEMTTLRRRRPNERFERGLARTAFTSPGARLAASEAWRSDAGLLAAMRVGIAPSERHTRPEVTSQDLNWLVRPEGHAPDSLIWSDDVFPPIASDGLESWFLSGQGLTRASHGLMRDRAAVVVGDTGTDFALALAYDRILGLGIWLTPSTLRKRDTLVHVVNPAIWNTISDLEQSASHLVVTSSSLTPRQIRSAAERIQIPEYDFQLRGLRRQSVEESDTVQIRFADVGRGFNDYVIDEHVGVVVSVPVSTMPDGSMDALVGVDTPVPSALIYPPNSGPVPYWYVDVTVGKDFSPRARDVPAAALTIEEGPFREVKIRPSKDGLSFDPSSMGFVSSGSFFSGRVGRPRVRSLSMTEWVGAMAEAEGLGVRLSTPGRLADRVAARLGGRSALLDLLSSRNLRMLRAFVRRDRAPKPSERDPETVVLGVDPYLSFLAIHTQLAGPDEETTAVVDSLISTGLLRRGLVLDCTECGRPSFVDADRIGQRFECPQCATENALVSERWKAKTAEPGWFYDLNTTFRELLAANGDVPLLAAAELKRKSNTYVDTPEVEFYDLSTKAPVAEIDVIASVNREVVVVEAKSNGAFGSGRRGDQTRKLLRIASVVRADRLILATTQDHWSPGDLEHIGREIRKVSPFPPRMEPMVSLG